MAGRVLIGEERERADEILRILEEANRRLAELRAHNNVREPILTAYEKAIDADAYGFPGELLLAGPDDPEPYEGYRETPEARSVRQALGVRESFPVIEDDAEWARLRKEANLPTTLREGDERVAYTKLTALIAS